MGSTPFVCALVSIGLEYTICSRRQLGVRMKCTACANGRAVSTPRFCAAALSQNPAPFPIRVRPPSLTRGGVGRSVLDGDAVDKVHRHLRGKRHVSAGVLGGRGHVKTPRHKCGCVDVHRSAHPLPRARPPCCPPCAVLPSYPPHLLITATHRAQLLCVRQPHPPHPRPTHTVQLPSPPQPCPPRSAPLRPSALRPQTAEGPPPGAAGKKPQGGMGSEGSRVLSKTIRCTTSEGPPPGAAGKKPQGGMGSEGSRVLSKTIRCIATVHGTAVDWGSRKVWHGRQGHGWGACLMDGRAGVQVFQDACSWPGGLVQHL